MTTTTETKSSKHAQAGKYLTFGLGEESYGVAVLKVREIIKMQDITMVPQMPSFIRGVINLRGKIIPVIDLRIKFGLEKVETTEATCIIVVNHANHDGLNTQMGLIVDGVEEVLNIADTDIEDTPNFGNTLESVYILGMAKIKGSVKTLLDIDKVVESDAVMLMQKAVAQS